MRSIFRGSRGTLPALAFFSLILFSAWTSADTSHAEAGSRSDPVPARLMKAYEDGMSLDSLYYFLAGHALGRLSFDTAMAFNLSIPTPSGGPFRDSVLRQRHRLYVLSGLQEDADRLKDSLPGQALASPGRRAVEWEFRLLSGHAGEEHSSARIYPSGLDLGPLHTGGWQVRNLGQAVLPLPVPAGVPLKLGLGYDISKSYYKDSLDYRAEVQVKADRLLDRFSASLSAEAGRITGVGAVASFKGEATFLDLGASGFLLANAGFESEWERFSVNRYHAGWLTLYKEWEMRGGRAAQAALSGSLILMDPLQVPGSNRILFVDDVSKESPTHYRNADYQDSLPKDPPMLTYFRYTEHPGSLDFSCPQDVITLGPTLGHSFNLPMRLKAQVSGGYTAALFPKPFAWLETPPGAPFPGAPVPRDTVEFRGYALNRADGKYYPASIDQQSGKFVESYGPDPLRERRTFRLDHRLGADFALTRVLGGWGTLVLDAGVERTFSNLSGRAPVWVPEWDYNVSMRWTRTGRWP